MAVKKTAEKVTKAKKVSTEILPKPKKVGPINILDPVKISSPTREKITQIV